MHGVIVLLDPRDKTPQFRNATRARLPHPRTQILMLALAHHREKGLEEGIERLDLQRETEQLIEPRLLAPFRDPVACA